MDSQISRNLPRALSGRAVPLGFNQPSYRFPLPVACCSDTTDIQTWFYEYHGLFWFSVTVDSRITFNSVPSFSIQNCITVFCAFLRDYGFRLCDNNLSELRQMDTPFHVSPNSSEV